MGELTKSINTLKANLIKRDLVRVRKRFILDVVATLDPPLTTRCIKRLLTFKTSIDKILIGVNNMFVPAELSSVNCKLSKTV